MSRGFFVSSVCTIALLTCLIATPAAAQTVDKQVFFTFRAPVSLPGITLPAGRYLFSVADPDTGGTVVQVRSGDRMKQYGYFLVNREWASVVPQKPEVRLIERSSMNLADAIRAWWYPGQQNGYEFIYSKKTDGSISKANLD